MSYESMLSKINVYFYLYTVHSNYRKSLVVIVLSCVVEGSSHGMMLSIMHKSRGKSSINSHSVPE